MKEAIIVNLDGKYQEPTIVPDEQVGVTPVYGPALPAEDGQEQQEPEVTGYIIAEKVPKGLYMPRWDFTAYDGYQSAISAEQKAYQDVYATWSQEDEATRGDPPTYALPAAPAFWIEGMTQEEIDAIKNAPQPVTVDQRVGDLETLNATLMMDSANKDIKINQQNEMIADLMMTVAQLQAGGAA